MQVKTEGLIIKEQTVGESDRLVTVLTRDEGVIKAFARRAKNLKDSKNSATGLLSYSRLSIYKGRDKYIIDDASPLEAFFGLRKDIGALSLAQYFCELSALLVPEETNTAVSDSQEYLRLVLNSLSFLAKGTKPQLLIKAVTELRMLAVSGYMPDLVYCRDCGCYEHEEWAFFARRGFIVCGDCLRAGGEPYTRIPQGVLTAMRHIIYTDFPRIYSFALPLEALELLARVVEDYTVNILGKRPMTLDFYHSIS